MTEAETRFFATLITGFFWCRQGDEAKPHASRPQGRVWDILNDLCDIGLDRNLSEAATKEILLMWSG